MKILSWYIARTFVRYWILTLSALVLFVLLADLLGSLEDVFTSWARFTAFLEDNLRSLPRILDILLPMTVLLATVFTFSALGRGSELVALRSAGMGTWRQLRPVFAVLVLIAGLDYANQNYFFPLVRHENSGARDGGEQQHWQALDGRIYYLQRIDSADRRLGGVRIMEWDEDPYRLVRFYSATRAHHTDPERWVLEDVISRRTADGLWTLERTSKLVLPAAAFPNVFLPVELDAHHMPFFDLYRKIRQLESRGRPVELYWLEWYQKTAAFFAPFLLVWFGASLSQAHHRKGRASGDIMVSLLGGLVFMIATEIFFTLGQGGYLGPVLATWSVNVLFLLFASVLMLRVR